MAQYRVVKLKERKTLAEDLEATLNEQAADGWSFVEMERVHRTSTLFLLLVFRKN